MRDRGNIQPLPIQPDQAQRALVGLRRVRIQSHEIHRAVRLVGQGFNQGHGRLHSLTPQLKQRLFGFTQMLFRRHEGGILGQRQALGLVKAVLAPRGAHQVHTKRLPTEGMAGWGEVNRIGGVRCTVDQAVTVIHRHIPIGKFLPYEGLLVGHSTPSTGASSPLSLSGNTYPFTAN